MRSLLVLCLLVASSYGANFAKTVIDPTLNWRVIGGTNAPEGAYPHQISLRYFGSHRCGGSIVDGEWVITAAHCIDGISAGSLKIVAGSTKLNTGGDTYQVLEVHKHESYSSRTGLNDAAILKVEKITFNDNVKAISVEKEDVAGDVPVILSGWGSTRLGGPTPNDLQHVNLKTTTVEQCQKDHVGSSLKLDETNICSLTKAGEGACHGDSGGPLITNEGGNPKVVGIVNWGSPCARGKADVYARVSSFVPWFNGICKCL